MYYYKPQGNYLRFDDIERLNDYIHMYIVHRVSFHSQSRATTLPQRSFNDPLYFKETYAYVNSDRLNLQTDIVDRHTQIDRLTARISLLRNFKKIFDSYKKIRHSERCERRKETFPSTEFIVKINRVTCILNKNLCFKFLDTKLNGHVKRKQNVEMIFI